MPSKSSLRRNRPSLSVAIVFLVAIRIFLPLFVFSVPLWMFLLSLLVDALDGQAFFDAGFTWRVYNRVDKTLDYWWYLWILAYLWYTPVFVPALVLLVFRTVGQLWGVLRSSEQVYRWFPNVFEWFFGLYLVAPTVPLWGMLALSFCWGIFVEWLIHKSTVHFLSRYLFRREIVWKK